MMFRFLLTLLMVVGYNATTATAYKFPYGRCYVNSCLSSPYKLEVNKTSTERGRICFTVKGKECIDTSKYNCCEKFYEQLEKFVFRTNPRCSKSVKQVTVNGIKKAGGVFFDLYNNNTGAELRITSLRTNYTTVIGKEICIHLDGACTDVSDFCDSETECQYASFDPFLHACCPSCEAGFIAPRSDDLDPNPPPPLRPSPSSPSPKTPVARLPPPSPLRPPTPTTLTSQELLIRNCTCTCFL